MVEGQKVGKLKECKKRKEFLSLEFIKTFWQMKLRILRFAVDFDYRDNISII